MYESSPLRPELIARTPAHPTTGITLASQWYTTGGCICGTVAHVHVVRVPVGTALPAK